MFARVAVWAAAPTLLLLAGCAPRPDAAAAALAAQKTRALADRYLNYLHPQPIGAPVDQPPWIAHVLPVDLDKD